ncbi:MAG: alkaline phosphatase family protein [Clostridia bacterium]|nr:alkaline phosphatase family protein [Clostridia bacterium]
MNNKVILISIDGMRPDGFLACGNPFIHTMMEKGAYTLCGQTVLPSVTLPCHMSMFHSVPPQRHGILSNTYTPLVRPLNGLMEQIKNAGRVAAMFYGWEPLRDISRPSSLKFSQYIHSYAVESSDSELTDAAIACIERHSPDFVFLYMVETDEKGGHDNGWMSEEYLRRIAIAIENVKRVFERFGDEYNIIVTADHGGHERSHGTDMPDDMTIPLFFIGEGFTGGKQLSEVTILDVAPTAAALLGIPAAPEWEGRALVPNE